MAHLRREFNMVNLLMAIMAGLCFVLSFRVNQLLDDFTLFSPGISLLFVPAGVKLLFVLVGGMPAIAGLLAAGVYLGVGIWPDKSFLPIFYFAFVSLMTYSVSVYFVMRSLKIDRDLSNLRYWHIVLLSLTASVTNGIVHNFLYMTQDVTAPHELWLKAAAMSFGDFMGCFVVVALFNLAVSQLRPKAIRG